MTLLSFFKQMTFGKAVSSFCLYTTSAEVYNLLQNLELLALGGPFILQNILSGQLSFQDKSNPAQNACLFVPPTTPL